MRARLGSKIRGMSGRRWLRGGMRKRGVMMVIGTGFERSKGKASEVFLGCLVEMVLVIV